MQLGTLEDAAARKSPYEFFGRIRAQAPVYRLPDSNIYLVSTHALIKQVVRDTVTFSNELPEGQSSHHNHSAKADRLLQEKGFGRRIKTIANHDPPGHYAYRRMMGGILNAETVAKMAKTTRQDVARLIEAIDVSKPCDIVEALTVPIPLYVISDLMGIERKDFLRFKDWAAAALYQNKPPQPEEALIRDAELIVEMQHYLVAIMADRRKHPRDDVITKLVQAKLNDERLLTDIEILSILELFILAGAETTTNAMGNAILYLAEHPEAEHTVRQSLDRINDVADELLRLESSVSGIWRNVTRDTELGGVAIAGGAKLILAFGPSNWDDGVFPDARAFDLDRPNMRDNFAFGSGIHLCIGNMLARMELRIFFELFLKAFSSFRLAVDRSEIDYLPFLTLRGPERIPLWLTRSSS